MFNTLSLKANANVKQVDPDGRTCIQLARASPQAPSASARKDLVDLLLAAGCPEAANAGGTLPRGTSSSSTVNVRGKVTSSVL